MTDWFLPPGTPGSPDEWCFRTIETADLRVFVNYQDYYARLADLISLSKTGDEVLLLGWGFGLEQELKRGGSALQFMEAAQKNGARVRILSTPSHGYNDNNKQMERARKKLDARVDNQLRPGAVHHQKAALIQLKSGPHVLLGGMDVTTGRVGGWFDVQVEVIGAGASLGALSMEERWESLSPPLGGVSATKRTPAPADKNPKHQVQFVRTYAPFPTDAKELAAWKRNYAPQGDHTYFALVSQAIAQAKKTIYIEDQFLWPMVNAPKAPKQAGGSRPRKRSDVPDKSATLEGLLAQAIRLGVKVVAIGPDMGQFSASWEQSRKGFVDALQNKRNPPVLLEVPPDMMFVHTKTWIFDDEFVVVGSANVWGKSYVSVSAPAESEFGVGFTSTVDGAALGFPKASFARALRIRLWERIRQTRDATYVFPRKLSATFDEEVAELKKPIKGKAPLLPM
jgi:phosphatidylserine/phosphatidylglycerophosphate/cardiolipin synthase-like enzyme